MTGPSADRVAVYSTIHPGSVPYVGAWFESLCAQTAREFDLWIGLDGVDPRTIGPDWSRAGGATFVEAAPGDTPARVRERAWRRIIADYDVIVMVDSDDVLAPTRVSAARQSVSRCDVSACALELIDEGGRGLAGTLATSAADARIGALVSHNVFGLSNTTWRSAALEACLSGCEDCVLLDWFLATRACLQGRRLGHDPRPRMLYRLHGANVTPVLPPFSADRIRRNTELVLDHLSRLRQGGEELRVGQAGVLAEREAQVRIFHERVCGDERRMNRYLRKLNQMAGCLPWHACVAHPDLRSLWN